LQVATFIQRDALATTAVADEDSSVGAQQAIYIKAPLHRHLIFSCKLSDRSNTGRYAVSGSG